MNTHDIKMDLTDLIALTEKPPRYTGGTHVFWQDPHIAARLLEAHLDPACDIASKKHVAIDGEVRFIAESLGLGRTHSIIDLGCGPGLYCERFARYGCRVTGVDFSRNSIDYAITSARRQGLTIAYTPMNYLELKARSAYDMACMINYDFGALWETDMHVLLDAVHRALKPGGVFVFDVFTPARPAAIPTANWYVSRGGFWDPGAHLVLENGFEYPDDQVRMQQHIVVTPEERRVYRIYDTLFSVDSITSLLTRHGFAADIYADLTGTALTEGTETLGIFARKAG